jgi:hypothetical protein
MIATCQHKSIPTRQLREKVNPMTDHDAQADQIAAHLRSYHESPSTGWARLDRAEMEALVNSNPSREEVMAWLQTQIQHAEAERATLADLDYSGITEDRPAGGILDPERRFTDHFGVCPTCNKTDGYINIGRGHWFYCAQHKIKWCVGENLFSGWQDETEEQQRAIYDKLDFGTFTRV